MTPKKESTLAATGPTEETTHIAGDNVEVFEIKHGPNAADRSDTAAAPITPGDEGKKPGRNL